MQFKELKEWVGSKAQFLVKRLQSFAREPHTYENGDSFWFLGQRYTLCVQEGKKDRVVLEDETLSVESTDTHPITIKDLVKQWYAQQATRILQDRFEHCLQTFQTHSARKPRLIIKAFKARWGHMTRDRVMALNIYLVQSPMKCVDYVIFHELTHMLHFDHQTAFHALLEQLVPQHRQVVRELNRFNRSIPRIE